MSTPRKKSSQDPVKEDTTPRTLEQAISPSQPGKACWKLQGEFPRGERFKANLFLSSFHPRSSLFIPGKSKRYKLPRSMFRDGQGQERVGTKQRNQPGMNSDERG